MALPERLVIETRYEQVFPTLSPAEIDRLRRFGEQRTYGVGERLVTSGEVSPGMFVILSGEVAVTQHSALGHDEPIVTHGPGSFMGELAQLSDRPSLVDARATKPVVALVITSRRLRDVLASEAEVGERVMRALILRRVGLLQSGISGPVIVGHAEDADVLRLDGFLSRSGHPHLRLDPDTDSCAKTLVERFHLEASELPIVLCPNGRMLRNPSDLELAGCIGLVKPIDPTTVYDVAIIGAGPAGLAAAVYAASEGLSVIVLDSRAFGGQAGASMRIENYLGFPTRSLLRLANGERARARTVVVASGAKYRRLDLENLAEFEGSGVHYWASPLEGKLCAGQEVALVGAGNSAGQATVYLSSQVAKVWLIARGRGLEASMSRYLVDRIASLPNVEVLLGTEVFALEGRGGVLEAIRTRHVPSGEEKRRPLRHLFLFIGADPNTSWLSESGVELDAKGFVRTGADVAAGRRGLETSRDGVFAIGDVRAGSTKRVAAAVGEGAQVIATIHAFLADAGEQVGVTADHGRV